MTRKSLWRAFDPVTSNWMGAESRLAINVRRLREERGWSQEALAHAAGVAVRHLVRVEGAETDPKLSLVDKLALGLGVDVTELLAGPPEPR